MVSLTLPFQRPSIPRAPKRDVGNSFYYHGPSHTGWDGFCDEERRPMQPRVWLSVQHCMNMAAGYAAMLTTERHWPSCNSIPAPYPFSTIDSTM